MKNNTNTATIDTAAVKEAVKESGVSQYAPNAMRPLIIQKSLDGQRRAINRNQAEDCGLESAFESWVYMVGRLYEGALAYSNAIGKDNEDATRESLWDAWKQLLKVGEEDALHPRMWVREKDVENLRVLAAESDELHIDGVGFVPTVKGKVAFRSKIEIRLACRIAGNATLDDDDRQTILDMRKAERSIKTAEEILHGNGKTGDDFVPGVNALIAAAEKDREELRHSLELANVKEPERFLKEKTARVNDLNKRKDAAEKRLKKAKTNKEGLQTKYDEIIARLDAIEG